MRIRRRCSAILAAAYALTTLSSVHAMAGQDAFTIDMTEGSDDAWANIAMANDDTVQTGVNIRRTPDADGEVAGFLYRGGAVYVLRQGEEWSEVTSGSVTGYIRSEYLTFGAEAKGLAEYYGSYGVKTAWDDVKVFAGESADARIVQNASDGATFRLVGKNGDWMQVTDAGGSNAYVPAEDVHLVMVVDTAAGLDEVDDGSQSVFTEDVAGAGAPLNDVSSSWAASDAYAQMSAADSTVDPSYTLEDTNDQEEPADTSVSIPVYTAQVDTQGSLEDLQSQANALYQQYLTAQAAADDAVAKGADAQTIADTAAAATAAYETFLQAQNLADQASWGGQSTGQEANDTGSSENVQSPVYEEPHFEDAGSAVAVGEPAENSQEDSSGAASHSSASDLELLAALIYCEAGNQPYEGQVAVGAVVMNRVKSGSFPNSVYEVINQSGQFTPSYSGVLAAALANGSGSGYIGAASDAMAGSDPTGGCLYFNNHQGSGLKIGDHWFF